MRLGLTIAAALTLVCGAVSPVAAQQKKAAAEAQANLNLLKSALDKLSSQAGDVKLACDCSNSVR